MKTSSLAYLLTLGAAHLLSSGPAAALPAALEIDGFAVPMLKRQAAATDTTPVGAVGTGTIIDPALASPTSTVAVIDPTATMANPAVAATGTGAVVDPSTASLAVVDPATASLAAGTGTVVETTATAPTTLAGSLSPAVGGATLTTAVVPTATTTDWGQVGQGVASIVQTNIAAVSMSSVAQVAAASSSMVRAASASMRAAASSSAVMARSSAAVASYAAASSSAAAARAASAAAESASSTTPLVSGADGRYAGAGMGAILCLAFTVGVFAAVL